MSMIAKTPQPPEAASGNSLWQKLTRPSDLVTDLEKRRNAQLLASILLIIIPLSLLGIGAIVPNLLQQGTNRNLFSQLVIWAATFFEISVITGYSLSRTKWFQWGMYSVTVSLVALIVSLEIVEPSIGPMIAIFVILALVLTGIFTTGPQVVIFGIYSVAALLVIPLFQNAIPLVDILPITVLVVEVTAIMVLEKNHRSNIEKERRAEIEVARNEAVTAHSRLDHLISSSPTMIFSARPDDFGVTFVSANVEEITGYKAEELLSRATFWLEHVHPDDASAVFSGMVESFEGNEISQIYRFQVADGTYRWMQVDQRLFRNAQGDPVEFIGSVVDVTDLQLARRDIEKQADELRRANAVVREASRLKSEFLATMSHELRTPLNAMIGYAEIMLAGMSGTIDEDATDMVSRIHSNSKRLLTLINDVLDLSKIEARRLEVVNIAFTPEKLLSDIRSQVTSLITQKKLEFSTELDSTLPARMMGDINLLERILINLLSNAIKFTDAGEVRLKVASGDNGNWQITISDTGIGIPSHAREYIFDPFRQIDGSSSRAYGGTGLGLAITQELVRAMQGTIQVESTVGQGSIFIVTLPLLTEQDMTQESTPS